MLTIYRSEGSASLRRVPLWLMGSDGTTPAGSESGGQPQVCWHPRGTATVNTSGTLSLVSANAGLYHVELTASEVSALGVGSIHYRSATAIANTAFFKIVNYDSGDSIRLGQFALPNAAANASGGLPQKGTTHSDFTVRIEGVNYSGATVGAGNFAPGTYSGVSFSIRDSGIATSSFQAGNYSGVSVEIKTKGIATNSVTSGTYSGVTWDAVTEVGSTVSIHAGTHSNVTIQGVTLLNSNVTLRAGVHSSATIQGLLDPTEIWNASRSSYSAFGGFGAASQVVSVLTAQGGTTSTITLNSAETTTDSFYNGCLLMIQYPSGFRAGAIISSYSGSQKSALLLSPLGTAVPSGATYIIYPGQDASIGLSVWSSYLTRSITSIGAGSFSGVTIDGVKFLSTAGERSVASSLLSTNLGGTNPRLVQEALFVLRNKVLISGSTMTVYLTDDTTSSWTATISTGTATVYGVDPGI